MIQFTNFYSYLAANIVQLRIYAMQLERLAELLKGSAPNMFCNNLCLPQSLSGTLYHCTQKNKPSEYIFLPKIVSQSHLSIGLLEKVEEGDADGSKEEHDHTQPMFCNRLANFSTLLISALSNINIGHHLRSVSARSWWWCHCWSPPSPSWSTSASSSSWPPGQAPPSLSLLHSPAGSSRHSAGELQAEASIFWTRSQGWLEPNIDEVETPGPGIKTTSPNCFLLSGGF